MMPGGYDLDEVSPGIYVGSVESARHTSNLQAKGITHILTVEFFPLAGDVTTCFTYMFIRADDDFDQDLLSYFPHTNTFIGEALQGGKVLVHCAMGVSRSATIAAAYLMKRYGYTVDEALKSMRKKRYVVPNLGFLTQLRVYERLACKIDNSDPTFRLYRLKRHAHKMRYPGSQKSYPTYFCFPDPEKSASSDDIAFKCFSCNRKLFVVTNLVYHERNKSDNVLDWKRHMSDLKSVMESSNGRNADVSWKMSLSPERGAWSNVVLCSDSLCIEPVQWMCEELRNQSGPVTCPRCSECLGSFDWRGEKCFSCQAIISPVFQFQTEKIKKCDFLLRGSSERK